MNCCALIISSNFCNEMFHQSGMSQYLFLLQQKMEETPKTVQFTQNTLTQNGGCHRMKGCGRKQETDHVRKGREVKGEKCEGEAAAGEEGERELDSLMWLLWPGSLQRSRLLHLHFSLKIAPVIIYSVGRAHPVLCSRDHCSCPTTGRHSSSLSLPSSQLDVWYSLFSVYMALGLTP